MEKYSDDTIKALLILKDTHERGYRMHPIDFAREMWGTATVKGKIASMKAGRYMLKLKKEELAHYYCDMYGRGIEYFITPEGRKVLMELGLYN